jgi:hypothetical protein
MISKRLFYQLFSIFFISIPAFLFADGKPANIKLSFVKADTVKTCKVIVDTNKTPVKGVNVKFYAKRFFSLLPLGSAQTTDEQGAATVDFPTDLPGGTTGMISIIAKIEDDDNFANSETEDSIAWGSKITSDNTAWNMRSLSASREKAPMMLIIASNVIIAGIWGTLVYVVFQLFRIKKAAKTPVKK